MEKQKCRISEIKRRRERQSASHRRVLIKAIGRKLPHYKTTRPTGKIISKPLISPMAMDCCLTAKAAWCPLFWKDAWNEYLETIRWKLFTTRSRSASFSHKNLFHFKIVVIWSFFERDWDCLWGRNIQKLIIPFR